MRYYLVVKGTYLEALSALDTNTSAEYKVSGKAIGSFGSVALTVDFDSEDTVSESQLASKLNEWMSRDSGLKPPYPVGSLLYWRSAQTWECSELVGEQS